MDQPTIENSVQDIPSMGESSEAPAVPVLEPVRIPPTPSQSPRRHRSHSNDVVVLNQVTLYLVATAILFFIAGFAVAWATFATRNDPNGTMNAARDGVKTAVAELSSAQAAPTEIPRQNVGIDDSMPSWGPKDAKVTVVEFSDFQCPYCEAFYKNTYQQLKSNYGDKIHFVFRHFPLSIHPDAQNASLAAECAKEQGKFWEYHNILFENQSDLSRQALIKDAGSAQVGDVDQFTKCFDTKKYQTTINTDMQAGDGYFVNGTPTFFINGNVLVGAQDFTRFRAMIDKELQSGG